MQIGKSEVIKDDFVLETSITFRVLLKSNSSILLFLSNLVMASKAKTLIVFCVLIPSLSLSPLSSMYSSIPLMTDERVFGFRKRKARMNELGSVNNLSRGC